MSGRSGVVVTLALTCACGGSTNGADGGVDGTTDAAVALRTVSGTLNHRHVTASGEVVVPADLSMLTCSALVPPAFTAYPGITTANGTFSIPGVPVGTYYLKLGTRYIVRSDDSVDLSFDVLGRPYVTFATTPTNLSLNVGNLSTWQSTDEIQMFSPDTGTAAYAVQAHASAGAPTAGDTSLAGLSFDLSKADYPALLDGSLGDQLTITQLATQVSGGRNFRTPARSFVPASFSVTNGGSANITGTFSTVTPAATLDAVWNRPAFDTELVARSPRDTNNNWSTFAVSALPEAATRGLYHDAADVVVFAPGYLTDSTTVNASWPYGDPYPSAWTRIAWVRYFTYRFVQLGTATPTGLFARLLVYRDASTVSAQAPIVPIVGAVVSPRVNSLDAFGGLTGIGATPTISWLAPTVGIASRYYVTIDQVTAQNGATVVTPIASIETSDTHVVVPPGILMTGNAYAFEIGARSAEKLDLNATPNDFSLPEGWATVTSAIATP